MDPITLALIVGLGGGVLGGAVSQLIAGWFKTRGDTRLLDAAAENAKAAELRWEREQAFEREKLVHASLRDACVRYQNQVDEILPLYWRRQAGKVVSDETIDDAWKILYKIKSEVELAVPIMRVPIAAFQDELKSIGRLHRDFALSGEPVPGEEFENVLDQVEDERIFLYECMTVALRTYDVGKGTDIEKELKQIYDKRRAYRELEYHADEPHVQPQLDEAPMGRKKIDT